MRNAVAVGKFDALHIGHGALAGRAAALGRPVLLRLTGLAEAFGWPARPALVAEQDRARILAAWPGAPAEEPVRIAELRELDAAGFIAWLVERLRAEVLVVGADFRCGRGRSAGVVELAPLCAAQGVRLDVVQPVVVGGSPTSSSRVREALAVGDLAVAEACLGRPHRICGTVVRGDGRGRSLGFPTANLGVADNQLPAPGVYAAWAGLDGRRVPAAVNIGVLPTIGDGRGLSVEAHLLNWTGDCYGMRLGLDLVRRLRPEMRFSDLAALRQRITADVAEVGTILRG